MLYGEKVCNADMLADHLKSPIDPQDGFWMPSALTSKNQQDRGVVDLTVASAYDHDERSHDPRGFRYQGTPRCTKVPTPWCPAANGQTVGLTQPTTIKQPSLPLLA